jgi:hypothetical protein
MDEKPTILELGTLEAGITLTLAPYEVGNLYAFLLDVWRLGIEQGHRDIGYYEQRLAYVRQFIPPEAVEEIESKVCPTARLLHD